MHAVMLDEETAFFDSAIKGLCLTRDDMVRMEGAHALTAATPATTTRIGARALTACRGASGSTSSKQGWSIRTERRSAECACCYSPYFRWCGLPFVAS